MKKTKVKIKEAEAGKLLSEKKEEKKETERSLKEKELLKDIAKKFGDGLVARASQIGYRSIPRIRTGVFALDVALGGGWAKSRMNMIWGPRSSCKTYLMLLMIARAQITDIVSGLLMSEATNADARPYKVAYIDVEGAFDFDWAAKLQVNLDELYYARPENAEQAAEMVETMTASGVFDIVVLDSLAAMTPEKEIAGEIGDSNVGIHARINSQMFRKVQSSMNKLFNEDSTSAPTFFVINQERAKIGVTFGSNKMKPGGYAQEFFTTIEVHTEARKVEYFDEEKSQPKVAHFAFLVEKNKAAPPKVQGNFIIAVADDPEGSFAAGNVLDDVTVHLYAERLGVFKKLDDSKWEMCGQLYKRKGDLLADWYQNPVAAERLRQQLLHILFPKVIPFKKAIENDIPKEKEDAGRSVEIVANAATEEPTEPGIEQQDRITA